MTGQPVAPIETPVRVPWFVNARFGMFIHWGLYAVMGRHEWAMGNERIPREQYASLIERCHPSPGCVRTWVKIAKEAGMRYVVLTTKHHDGFCLFPSKWTDYSMERCGRDLVREFVEACRAEGLKVGLYYSLMDWQHDDGIRCATDENSRQAFVRYTHGLVRELMTHYGQIDILWYDISWPLTPEGWESESLNRMVRQLQPDILINDRSGIQGDFATPEQHITSPTDGRMWEACMTFGEESWGYTPLDERYKNSRQVIRMLAKVANGNGNLLLNINPMGDGAIPQPIRQTLAEVGAWLRVNGEAIYHASDLMKPDHTLYGTLTRKGNTACLLVDHWPGGTLTLGGITPAVREVTYLDGKPIRFEYSGDWLVLFDLPELAPDPLNTVIKITCEGPPTYDHGPSPVVLDRTDPWKRSAPAGMKPVMSF
jgi:alpha-L-fucosidase